MQHRVNTDITVTLSLGVFMKLKSLVLVAALALPMLSASAATSTFSSQQALFFNDPLATGAFTQTVSFSGLSAGLYDIFGTLNAQNLTLSSVELDGKAWDLTSYISKGKPAAFGYLDVTNKAPILLTLKGTALNFAAYSGNLSVTLVPEPESYAMMVAGLGLLGTIARRRIKASDR